MRMTHTHSTYIDDPELSATEFAGRRLRARLAARDRARRARFIREGLVRGLQARPEHLKARDWELKVEVIAAYGGMCRCCGEATVNFLTLDDAVGGRQIIDGPPLWSTLKQQKFPGKDELVVTCFNCQMAGLTTDGCPHKSGVGATV